MLEHMRYRFGFNMETLGLVAIVSLALGAAAQQLGLQHAAFLNQMMATEFDARFDRTTN